MPTARRSTARRAPFLQSLELWNRLVSDQASMLMAAGEVIGRRTARMAAHGMTPDVHERKELRRMVEEKHDAMVEGSLAAWAEWMRLAQAPWQEGIRLAASNGAAFVPVMAGMNAFNAMARTQHYARRATSRSIASMTRQWAAPLDSPLKIADAALEPMRTKVAANRKRLAP